MLVKFRCKQSGNTVSFSDPMDIETMRKELHYEEIKDEFKETATVSNAIEASPNAEGEKRVLVKPKKQKEEVFAEL